MSIILILISVLIFSILYYMFRKDDYYNWFDYFFFSFNIQCFFGMVDSQVLSDLFDSSFSHILQILNILQILITFTIILKIDFLKINF